MGNTEKLPCPGSPQCPTGFHFLFNSHHSPLPSLPHIYSTHGHLWLWALSPNSILLNFQYKFSLSDGILPQTHLYKPGKSELAFPYPLPWLASLSLKGRDRCYGALFLIRRSMKLLTQNHPQWFKNEDSHSCVPKKHVTGKIGDDI